MDWKEVTIYTTTAGIGPVEALLEDNGVEGYVLEDAADFEEFLKDTEIYWDYVDEDLMERMKGVARVKFYVTDDAHGREKLSRITGGLPALRERCGGELGTLAVRTAGLREEDWANNWKQYYKPLTVGERLYIVPEWEKGEAAIPEGRTALYLNPGLIFGTGTHASTQLCLGGVEEFVKDGDRVLDLGCGSGILSIAALCLGAERAFGVDIDPKAVGVAYENAEMNGIGRDIYTVRAGNVLSDKALCAQLAEQKWNLVLANIVADVIIPLSAKAGDFLTEDGVFLCSGIIDTRADEVQAALEKNGLHVFDRREQNGWVALASKK